MYIELKTGYAGNGPAFIGRVFFSKTGRTLYYRNKEFKSLKGAGNEGNYYDIATEEEYRISGIRRDGIYRDHAESAKIIIDNDCIGDYLKETGKIKLDKSLIAAHFHPEMQYS